VKRLIKEKKGQMRIERSRRERGSPVRRERSLRERRERCLRTVEVVSVELMMSWKED